MRRLKDAAALGCIQQRTRQHQGHPWQPGIAGYTSPECAICTLLGQLLRRSWLATLYSVHTLGLGSSGSLPGFKPGRRDFQVRGLLSPTGSVTICFREAGRSGAAFPERQLEGRSGLSRFCSRAAATQPSVGGRGNQPHKPQSLGSASACIACQLDCV